MAGSSRTRRWVAALLAAAAALPARAGPDRRLLSQCIRERWTYRDGLPHNVVHRLLASRSGYLWIGSQEGLVRFDGVRFELFARPGAPGLAGNEITALAEGEGEVLWVGTATGLSRLEGDAFREVDLGADVAVVALADDGQGGVFVATSAAGVRHVRGGLPVVAEPVAGLAGGRVAALLWSGGALWVGGDRGLARLEGRRLEELGAAGLPGEIVSLAATPDGTLWVGTTRGLAQRPAGAAAFERVALPGTPMVYAVLGARDGAVWVGTGAGAVFRVMGAEVQVLAGATSPSDAHALAEDADGDVWSGTESAGLYRLRWGQAVAIAREEGLSSDVVWAVREGRGGVMWIASDGGLNRLAGGRLEPAHVDALRGASLAGLLEDRAGELWVGTAGAGLLRFGPRGTTRYASESGLRGNIVRVVHQDSRGVIWVGTTQGVFRMDGERFRALELGTGLLGAKVNTIEELPDGTLWVGTTTGLGRVEGERLVPVELGGQRFRWDVTALRAEADGAVWIGTVGDGLARLAGGRLERWSRQQGLYEDVVLGLLDDGAGHLWLSGNHGISRVGRAALLEQAAGGRPVVLPTVFGTADGMRDRECNGGAEPAAWRGADGRLWFATVRGAVVIDPARLQAPLPPPPARVEELVVDGRTWPPAQPLRFPAGTRRVEVRYTGLALAAADRIRFRHRLVGLDDGFVDAGGERVAYFTNLYPGRYDFEVAAAGATGTFGRAATVGFSVAPYFWQTGWFLAAVVLAALALVVGVHLARTAALRRREATLAARVEEEMRKVKVLSGLVPTCAWCKRIRDEGGRWQRFEAYVSAHADVEFTHGICPDCLARAGQDQEPEPG
jgi:ligand-binding sensor domain-containing protein